MRARAQVPRYADRESIKGADAAFLRRALKELVRSCPHARVAVAAPARRAGASAPSL